MFTLKILLQHISEMQNNPSPGSLIFMANDGFCLSDPLGVSLQFPGESEKIECEANHCLSESHSIFLTDLLKLVASFHFTCMHIV